MCFIVNISSCPLPAQPCCSPDAVCSFSAVPHTYLLATALATLWNGHASPHTWPCIRLCCLHIALCATLSLICLNHHFDHLICLLRILQQHLIAHPVTSILLTLAFRPLCYPSLVCFPAHSHLATAKLNPFTFRGWALPFISVPSTCHTLFLEQPSPSPTSQNHTQFLLPNKLLFSQIQSDCPSQERSSFLCTITTLVLPVKWCFH